MKNIFLISLFFLSNFYRAQSEIFDITESSLGRSSGYYRKDMNNLLNPFQGTYILINGDKIFKIVLKKMIKQPSDSHYEDMIIGEYEYVVNGVV